jgi:hypothetical protein
MSDSFSIMPFLENIRSYAKIAKRVLSMLLVSNLISSLPQATGHETTVHEKISEVAINMIQDDLNSTLRCLGFVKGSQEILSREGSSLRSRNIADWIKYGSVWEDDMWIWFTLFDRRGPLYNHFYNPLRDMGYYEESNGIIQEKGQSIIARANDYVRDDMLGWMNHNEWSYQVAKDFYYSALTGDSTKYSCWYTRQENSMVAYSFYGKIDMTDSERQMFFTWTFQAIGQILHLIQDSGVPAHTRNDLHYPIDWEPYEAWTKKNLVKISFLGPGSDPWYKWISYPNVQVPDVFIDTNSNNPILQNEGMNQGLAEYSFANFLSEDSISGYNVPEKGVQFCEDQSISGKSRKVCYRGSVNSQDGGVKHLLLEGMIGTVVYYGFPPIYDELEEICKIMNTVDDDKVHQDYAEKLIPRAVGYSAGFLEYFFRGQIEITAPNEYVYALIDGSVIEPGKTQQVIKKVKAKLRNKSSREKDAQGNIITYETMGPGELIAIAKYRIRPNYQADLSGDPPTYSEMKDIEFSYSVSEPIVIDALSSTEPEEKTFNFSTNPIPVGITDLYFQVVFRGTLGNEKDVGIAVGMKDLNEPEHIVSWNNTDYYMVDGVPMKAAEVIARYPAMRFNDYIYPTTITSEFSFAGSEQDVLAAPVVATINGHPPGRYSHFIALFDNPSNGGVWMKYREISALDDWHWEWPMRVTVNQEENGAIWKYTQVYNTCRGVWSHFPVSFIRYYESPDGPYPPVPDNPQGPYAITINFP